MTPASFRRALVGIATVCLCALLLSAQDASAQGRQAPGRPGGPGGRAGRQGPPPDGGATAADLQTLLDAMFVAQAQKDLELTDDHFSQFLRRLNMMLAGRRRAENQRNRAIMELRRLMQPADGGPDDARIAEQIKALDDLEAQSATEDRQARANIDQVLNIQQRGRFRLLEQQIERRKLELFARVSQPRPPQ